MSVDEIVAALSELTLSQAEELVEKLTEKFPKLAEMPAGGAIMMAGPAGAAAVAEVEEEPTEFNLILTDIGDQKVQVIKAVRELTSLGLKEAKEAVEGAPYTVLDAVDKAAAEAGKVKLEAAGAKGEVKPA
jgi:large subunit ribosomal protein L7/L12